MTLYQIQGLKQVFDGRTVLDITKLDLAAGRSYALLGPNGCGKTTLLEILAFLRPPASGMLRFKGREMDWRDKTLTVLRRQVVLVHQHPIMFTCSVLKNVEYGLRIRSVPTGDRRKRALECLDRVGMGGFASRPAHKLSGGETQRVAIARALACSPEVLLFDEPTAGVDVENQAVIEAIIREISKEKGILVVFSTHRSLEASRLSQERIFLSEGKLTGPGGENRFSGTVENRNGRTVCIIGGNIELDVSAGQPGPARVFIKPEGIRLIGPEQEVNTSLEGLVSGEIIQLTVDGDNVKILLDVGVPIRTFLPWQEFKQLRFLVGDRVKVAFEKDAARLEV